MFWSWNFHPVFLQNNSETIKLKSKSFCYPNLWVCYMSEDRLPQWQELLLSVLLYIVRDRPAAFDNPNCRLELPDKRKDQRRYVVHESVAQFLKAWNIAMIFNFLDIP